MPEVQFSDLIGQTLKECYQEGQYEIYFVTVDGRRFKMYHEQDCCESVTIDDVNGDLQNLVGNPILIAEETTSQENPKPEEYKPDSFTWTFYRLATIKGYVTIRWYGESNGYYSESVYFAEIKEVD